MCSPATTGWRKQHAARSQAGPRLDRRVARGREARGGDGDLPGLRLEGGDALGREQVGHRHAGPRPGGESHCSTDDKVNESGRAGLPARPQSDRAEPPSCECRRGAR